MCDKKVLGDREIVRIPVVRSYEAFLPKYSNDGDSGMDVRAYLGENFDDIKKYGDVTPIYDVLDTLVGLKMAPNSRVLIASGLNMAIPYGYEIQARPRSGLALKYGITLSNAVGTIDSGYRGDCGFIIQNNGLEDYELMNSDRIGQFVLMKVPAIEWVEVDSLESSERGEGGYGHTGVK